MGYSIGFRNNLLKKVLPPENRTPKEVAAEAGVAEWTLRRWLKMTNGSILPEGNSEIAPMGRNAVEKLKVLLDSRRIPESDMGSWLREQGLHSEHLPLYEQELVDIVNEKSDKQKKRERELKKENNRLQRELKRKDKALAEMAALITLKKKADLIWGDEEEDSYEPKKGQRQ